MHLRLFQGAKQMPGTMSKALKEPKGCICASRPANRRFGGFADWLGWLTVDHGWCVLMTEVFMGVPGGSPGSTADFNGAPKSTNLLHWMPLANENITGVQWLHNAGTGAAQSSLILETPVLWPE